MIHYYSCDNRMMLGFKLIRLTFEVTRPALAPQGREPRRYGFPFLYEKIVTYRRNGKTCNEARMSYGCGPEGREALSPRAKPRSRYEWHSRLRESEAELPPGANGLRDDCGIGFTVCSAIVFLHIFILTQ